MSTLRAGVGRVSITPPLSAPHASWGAQVHVLPDGMEADLWATALVLDDDERRVAWIDLDLVLISRAESDAIRRAVADAIGITPEMVRVSVTHNHAGPPPSSWNWTSLGAEALAGYYAQLPAYAAGAARLALAGLQPVRVAAGMGASRVAVNRREIAPDGRTVTGVNLAGDIDPDVFVLRLDDLAGQAVATVAGYTMHPTSLGPGNRLVSSDWPGHLKRTVEALVGGVCLFAQGCTGDIGPGPDGYADDVAVPRRLGAQVGSEAARVALGLPAAAYRHLRVLESGAPLGIWERAPSADADATIALASRWVELPLGPQPPLAEAQGRVAEAQAALDAARASGASAAAISAATFVVKRANMTASRAALYGGKTHEPVEVQGLRIGPALLIGMEGEPFSAIGQAVKAASPSPVTWCGGYCGGWVGYIPTPDAYPIGGYEVETSPFAPEAARIITEAAIGLVGGMFG